jgi:hypothetical protein
MHNSRTFSHERRSCDRRAIFRVTSFDERAHYRPAMRGILVIVCSFAAACSFREGTPSGSGGGGSDGVDAPGGDPNADTDGDGIVDLADNCPTVANTDQHDHDGDLRGDACDVCPHLADTGADFDGDGVGDACDPRPTQVGDRIVLFDGFYGPLAWTPVSGGAAWEIDAGTLRQPNADGSYQIVRVQTPAPHDVLVEARVRVNAVSQIVGARQSVGLVAGYQNTDDYFYCGIAATYYGSEVEAGRVDPYTPGGSFSYNQGDFGDQMTGDWLVLQARTVQAIGGDTHLDCSGARAMAHGNAGYDAQIDAGGEISLRTNGVDASFDYVFVVEVPQPTD